MTHTLYTHWQHTNTLLHFFTGGKSRPEPSHTPTRPPLKAADQDTALELCVRIIQRSFSSLFHSLFHFYISVTHTVNPHQPCHMSCEIEYSCVPLGHTPQSVLESLKCRAWRQESLIYMCVWVHMFIWAPQTSALHSPLEFKGLNSIITREPLEKEANLIIRSWQAASNFRKRPQKAANAPSYMTINYDGTARRESSWYSAEAAVLPLPVR